MESPVVSCQICLVTEPHSDAGLPHVLEHMVFQGRWKRAEYRRLLGSFTRFSKCPQRKVPLPELHLPRRAEVPGGGAPQRRDGPGQVNQIFLSHSVKVGFQFPLSSYRTCYYFALAGTDGFGKMVEFYLVRSQPAVLLSSPFYLRAFFFLRRLFRTVS